MKRATHIKKYLLIVCLLILGVVILILFILGPRYTTVKIGDSTIYAKVVSAPQQQVQGLSGTSKLPNNQGMLFVFPRSNKISFWMKGMHYNLDIIWINSSKRVVTIAQNLSPKSYPRVYSPTQLSSYVLEIDGGMVNRLGIHAGTQVSF